MASRSSLLCCARAPASHSSGSPSSVCAHTTIILCTRGQPAVFGAKAFTPARTRASSRLFLQTGRRAWCQSVRGRSTRTCWVPRCRTGASSSSWASEYFRRVP
eukprot:6498392-Prymnesium_polylepis.3